MTRLLLAPPLNVLSRVRPPVPSRRDRLLGIALAVLLGASPASDAQIVLLDQFNPATTSDLCGVGRDPLSGNVWTYTCSGATIEGFSAAGAAVGSVMSPGEPANDVDVAFTPEALTLGTTALPVGTLLFLNGENGPVEIYAVDKATGTVLATLPTAFGVSHVVGGAYHPSRNTFYVVQDNVPGGEDENRIAEVDPVSGAVLQTVQITALFAVSYGDLDVSAVTGHLFVVSSIETGIAEFTPAGAFVQEHALPAGVGSLSGLALDCAANEAWASNTAGAIFHLGSVPCGSPSSAEGGPAPTVGLTAARPNPANAEARLSLRLDRPEAVRVTVHDVLGREVARLAEGELAAGTHDLALDVTALPAGLYVVRASAGGAAVSQRLVVAR